MLRVKLLECCIMDIQDLWFAEFIQYLAIYDLSYI